ncbi:tether containing UBX domain for GLUT4 [Colletes gigas]|uniref:tether containing UBX domain for GLUT4 n=1 Tax=Colletes gigas TaxID=935657 RepID=UPI001C9AC950|nr:tether containing UBX domain for GLUT4 [Colletes gigas]
MAKNGNVIILMPNGHRRNVKVTPNTTILQILEEVCNKHGYDPDDYDVKHFRRVLDPNAMLRFAGLSNNAQLEMIPCTKKRSTLTVTIAIQLENGERKMGEFMSNITLLEILQQLCLDQDLEKTLLTYMHREIYGIEALMNATLKSLGITNGKAVLRLMYRDPQQTDCQTSTIDSNKTSNVTTPLTKETQKSKQSEVRSQSVIDNTQELTTLDKGNEILTTEECQSMPSTSTNYAIARSEIISKPSTTNGITDTNEIEFLGERNAMVFNLDIIEALPEDEVPDVFYDVTVDDAKVILRDFKRRREELEEAPFLTKVQRELNEEIRTLSQLNKYHYTIIRIQFPDQFVLQGLFRPLETVQAIKDFVKSYLSDPSSEFLIFTTPPKHILNSSARLIDEDLVPSAIIHYSGQSALRSDIKQKLTDPKDVEMQVTKVRVSMTNQQSETVNKDANVTDPACSKPVKVCNASTSESKQNKIPAWLNLPFKK